MPIWAQVLLAAAAIVTAVGVLWTKVIKPGAKIIANAERSLPVLQELTVQMADVPHSFAILREIVAQLRTDSGSSLLDMVRRLDARADEVAVHAKVLQVNLEAQRRLAEQDRAAIARLTAVLDWVNAKMDVAATASDGVLSRLQDAAVASEVVAEELAASHDRATAHPADAPPGAAADAALRNPDEPTEGGPTDAADV